MYHQARLTKPEPFPGSTLLWCDPNNAGNITIVWTLPNQENFGLYKQGKMFSNQFVAECIKKYLENPRELMQPEDGQLPDEKIREIYQLKLEKEKAEKLSCKFKSE
jgi:hypothetical protein